MPRSNAPNPYALLDSVIRELGKEHIRKYLDHAKTEASTAAPENGRLILPGARKRKKRADAGKPRGPRKSKKAAKKKAASPVIVVPKAAVKRLVKRVQKAKPRVDPLTTPISLEGAV